MAKLVERLDEEVKYWRGATDTETLVPLMEEAAAALTALSEELASLREAGAAVVSWVQAHPYDGAEFAGGAMPILRAAFRAAKERGQSVYSPEVERELDENYETQKRRSR